MHYNLSTRLVLAAALAAGLLATSVASAAAGTTYDDGDGAFEAVTVLNTPPKECAKYGAYNAELMFAGNGIAATVSSGARGFWGEFADGTHLDNVDCADAPGQAITGFTGTLRGLGVNCTLSNGSYRRGHTGLVKPELNVEYAFKKTSGTCPAAPVTIKATIPSVDLPTPITVGPFSFDYLSACNSPIAPQSCVLDKANF
jgi:hypothetical protein